MVKKILVIAVVCVLCFAVGTSVFAVASPSGGSVAAVDPDTGAAVPVTITSVDAATKTAITPSIDTKKAPGELKWFMDIEPAAGHSGPLKVTIVVSGLVQGRHTAVAVHYVDGKGWEYIPAAVSNGQVTFTLTSFSPVGIVVNEVAPVTQTTTPANTNAAVTTTAAAPAATSPKTGNVDIELILMLVAVAAVCTAVFAGKHLMKPER